MESVVVVFLRKEKTGVPREKHFSEEGENQHQPRPTRGVDAGS